MSNKFQDKNSPRLKPLHQTSPVNRNQGPQQQNHRQEIRLLRK